MTPMTLKEFLEGASKNSPMKTLQLAEKLIELESIERYIQLVYGVELAIYVNPVPAPEGRFYGKSILDKLF